MLFNSLNYLVFLPLVVFLFFLIPFRFKWFFLILASYVFYCFWRPEFISIIIGITLLDFWLGKKIEAATDQKQKKLFLVLSLVANLGLLFFFKYYLFFRETVTDLGTVFGFGNALPAWKIILPIGISFHTFQTMSYNIDIYLGKIKAEKSLQRFAMYVAFFPQMVAGPIERAEDFLPQLDADKKWNWERTQRGLDLILWGLFKKIVVADRLAVYVDEVYKNPDAFGGLSVWIGLYAFSFQIYCDFSGYTDIARGSAQILGFRLSENFSFPYFASNITDFWRRWHQSLTNWFRDYVYIPLGGSKGGRLTLFRNTLVVFMLSGLWHGANYTFVVWGALHGLYVAVYRQMSSLLKFIPERLSLLAKVLGVIITFHLATFAWIYFRAESMAKAHHIMRVMFQGTQLHLGMREKALAAVLAMILFVPLDYWRSKKTEYGFWTRALWWSFFISMILGIGYFHGNQFIYFQF